MSDKPSIVITHGSWVNPGFYSTLAERLTGLGYATTCPLLPSCSPLATTETDLIDDALAIRGILTRLVEYDQKSVIVLMHSYGGLVGSEAVPEALTSSSRQKHGLAGGIQHLIYMGAFMLPVGQSCQSFYGDLPGSVVQDGFYTDPNAKASLFADVPSEEADVWLSKMIRHPFKVQQTTTTRAAYTYTPSTYIVFTQDNACPTPAQEQFAGVMGATIVKFESGHMAPITKPVELGDAVDSAIQASMLL